MKRISQLAAVIALGAACAVPAMAQGTDGAHGSAMAASYAPAGTGDPQPPATTTMGAGPRNMADQPQTQDDPHHDLGWLGLIGLAGLLGWRRRDLRQLNVRGNTRRTAGQR